MAAFDKIVPLIRRSHKANIHESQRIVDLKRKRKNMLVNAESLSYIQLHKKFVRATPKIFSLFQTAINFFNTKNNIPCDHIAKITSVTLSDRRNTRLSFVRNNRFKEGMNSIHNRLRSISNVLDKNWTDKSAADFKLNCKICIIQNSLMSL